MEYLNFLRDMVTAKGLAKLGLILVALTIPGSLVAFCFYALTRNRVKGPVKAARPLNQYLIAVYAVLAFTSFLALN